MRVPATLPTALPCVMGLELSPMQKLYTSSMSGRRLLEHCWRPPGSVQGPSTAPLNLVVPSGARRSEAHIFPPVSPPPNSNWTFQLLWEIVHVPDVQTALPKPHLASELSISPIPAVGMKTLFASLKTYFHPVLCRYLSFHITIQSPVCLYWTANWLLQPNINIHEEILALCTISLSSWVKRGTRISVFAVKSNLI